MDNEKTTMTEQLEARVRELEAVLDEALEAFDHDSIDVRSVPDGVRTLTMANAKQRETIRALRRQLLNDQRTETRLAFRRYALAAMRAGLNPEAALASARRLALAEHEFGGSRKEAM